MDKSEGTDFISGTLAAIGGKVAKAYNSAQHQITLASLNKERTEKINYLGRKIYELMQSGKTIEHKLIVNEYKAIRAVEDKITQEIERFSSGAPTPPVKVASHKKEALIIDENSSEETSVKIPGKRGRPKKSVKAKKVETAATTAPKKRGRPKSINNKIADEPAKND